MAQRIATLHAWDMLDLVNVAVHVKTYGPVTLDIPDTTYTNAIQVRGTGEEDDKEWLKDALVALIEAL